jgi:dihydropteroate synthase
MVKTQLMGILNATPDSYYDKSRFSDEESAVARGQQIFFEGADIIDVGGESTRPRNIYTNEDSVKVSVEEELRRVIPVITQLKQLIPIPISIDTMKPEVAAQAVAAGAAWINDVSGFRHPEMRDIAASSGVKICVMHMHGDPYTMQLNPNYDKPIINHIKHWFSDTLEKLIEAGVKEKNIVLDPGIGFGKTVAHNLEIIHNLPELKSLGFPVLLGLSRKYFMSKILNKPPTELLSATLAMNTVAILSKVDFIRVHDVREHRDIIDVLDAYAQ